MKDPPRCTAPAALAAAGIALAGLALGGCVSPETTEVHIRKDSLEVVHAVVTMRHLESDASTPAARRAEFARLIEDATGDRQLVAAARARTYMRDRRLYLADGVLCASYELLCFDACSLDVKFSHGYAPRVSPPAAEVSPAAATAAVGDSQRVDGGEPLDESPDSVIVDLRYRLTDADSVLATNATVITPGNGSRVLVWADSTTDKWARLCDRHFRAPTSFARLYGAWARGHPAHAAALRPRPAAGAQRPR